MLFLFIITLEICSNGNGCPEGEVCDIDGICKPTIGSNDTSVRYTCIYISKVDCTTHFQSQNAVRIPIVNQINSALLIRVGSIYVSVSVNPPNLNVELHFKK